MLKKLLPETCNGNLHRIERGYTHSTQLKFIETR